MKLFSIFFSKMIILITTTALFKPQGIQLYKVYNVPGVHLTSEWNNFKNDINLTTASYIFKFIFERLCFLNLSVGNICYFYSIIMANGLF